MSSNPAKKRPGLCLVLTLALFNAHFSQDNIPRGTLYDPIYLLLFWG